LLPLSLLAMRTVAVRAPNADGSKRIVKVVLPLVAATGEAGCRVTLKSAACSPAIVTRGVPVSSRSSTPVLRMVNVRALFCPRVRLPKSVSSAIDGVVSPFVIT
jgi:hypothetical protein